MLIWGLGSLLWTTTRNTTEALKRNYLLKERSAQQVKTQYYCLKVFKLNVLKTTICYIFTGFLMKKFKVFFFNHARFLAKQGRANVLNLVSARPSGSACASAHVSPGRAMRCCLLMLRLWQQEQSRPPARGGNRGQKKARARVSTGAGKCVRKHWRREKKRVRKKDKNNPRGETETEQSPRSSFETTQHKT